MGLEVVIARERFIREESREDIARWLTTKRLMGDSQIISTSYG